MKTIAAAFLCLPFLIAAASAQSEEQRTDQLNQAQNAQGADADQRNAQYQQQQQLYQQQQQQYQAQKQVYDAQASRYLAARDRYAAERARYRRGEWPKRYEKLAFVDSDQLIGAKVETYAGTPVGHVIELARADGRISAVRVAFDDAPRQVWIDRGDLKFDTEDSILVTDLAHHDLVSMASEQY
ncbi:PRC-barrel domain containing protein [Rhizomicrobium electricum]|uniref:PRC-barrel domain-containing protein n=1 Tax=Rhizomicrobium electricum TaxID=480070 RepID=A0ABN1EFZ7_9PROT|nr:PRC-barrel domain containing protein [Rhizomicrobium electricum]NIJ48612.1 multidrug efflux pump subunit AcrA (membrane-fusion protein) [Rhizomicrobium electricum]